MTDRIISVLKSCGIEKWNIVCELSSTQELFYIKKELDLKRIRDVDKHSVTVYRDIERDGAKLIGSGVFFIHPDMSDDEIAKSVMSAYASAQYAGNPEYELADAVDEPFVKADNRLSKMTIDEIARGMSAALFESDNRADSFMNSAELFATRREVYIRSSKGTNVGYEQYMVSGEFVVQCKEPQDVELYRDFSYTEYQPERLSAKVEEALRLVRDRANATESAPKGSYDVLLTGDNLVTVMSYYLKRSEASAVFAGYTDFEVGKGVQGDAVTGDRLNITLCPVAPYSLEGVRMRELRLVEDGVLTRIYGGVRFCRYLGIEPTGIYSKFGLKRGKADMDELKAGRVLYPVTFSDFQMDEISGNFGGEIRLAYLYEDGKVTLVTGGSINGNIRDGQGSLRLSELGYEDSGYEGPYAVRIANVSVAGR